MGKVLQIAIREASRAPMQILDVAQMTTEKGVVGDFRGTVLGRQVTVVVREAWEAACADLGMDVDWTTRRANVLVEGLDLNETTGKQLNIGDVVLEITGETTPCPRMEEAQAGLQDALASDWRAGVTCVVYTGGEIRVGDVVRLDG
ncbi:MAG: MOSC domain-containing protein YiiM [Candidatus Latescibacterota bacterium]|jgi:MOSC domain-containing protein YiiM